MKTLKKLFVFESRGSFRSMPIRFQFQMPEKYQIITTMPGRNKSNHPPNARRHPGVVLVIGLGPDPRPVGPPIASLNQIHERGRIRKSMATKTASFPPLIYAATIYAMAIAPESLLLTFIF